ncbi:MAG: hypothetical protein KIH01_07430 [Candidatus Freyarchaeota archaeon]|nr:hypothetical protein [Candidatus Jordarchaeia archaeon]
MSSPKRCTPLCKLFRCANRSMRIMMHSGNKKFIWCQWAEDPCQGPSCKYAVCVKGQLQKDLTCGLSVRKEHREAPEEEESVVFEEENPLTKAKVKPRVLKKIKELEY